MTDFKKLNFEEIKEALLKNNILLIDVRNVNERSNPGRIPGTVNVPLGEFRAAFEGTDEAFVAEYDFKKPNKDAENLVVHCKSGKRATEAAKILQSLGYKVAIYEGSFDDWVKQGGKILTNEGCPILDFNQVSNGLKNKSILLIDVRNPNELKSEGKIVGSYNVPLPEIWDAFHVMTSQQFRVKYGFDKPEFTPSKPTVLHCKSGKRATDAADRLTLLGYDVSNYKGSWLDWKKNNGPTEAF